MRSAVSGWQMGGFVFTSVLGTLLHFLFDLSGGSIWAAPFSGVNESIWEHMKLLYVPLVVWATVEYGMWGRGFPDFWWVKLQGILRGLILVPVLYYSYTGILGVSADWFNITIFFLAAMAAFRWETLRFARGGHAPLRGWAAVALIVVLGGVFVLFTFRTPELPVFRDPITGTYGFQG